jgi:catecholate siderophore receptor
VNGGLRWDYFNLDYLSIPAAGAATNLGRIDRMLSWQTGIVYKPQENGSIYAAYGTSFNPSAEGLALSTTLNAANNVNVDPEESRSVELGTKWEVLDQKLSLGAAIFRTDKNNARTEDPADPNDIVVLDGAQRVNGLELSLAGNITEKWNAFAGYTFLMSEIRSSKNTEQIGEELGNTPKNTFNLWTTYQLPANFEAGGGVQFVDVRSNTNASSRQADAYILGDAMLAYKVNEDITMRLNAYNIGDAEYLGSLSGGHAIPGAGRSAVLSTDFKF